MKYEKLYIAGMAPVNWGSVFHRYEIEQECRFMSAKYSSLVYLLKTICLAFVQRDKYTIDKKGSKILFYLSYQDRKSYIDNFLRIKELVKSDMLRVSERSYNIQLVEGIKFLIYYFPVWYFSITKVEANKQNRMYLIHEILRIYQLHRQLLSIDIKSYNLLVTFYDSYALESYIVELFKLGGVKTASLQHGQFTAWCEDSLINSGVELRTFKSDYLLCWNRFTVDEAIKCGVNPNRLEITGIWSYVNTPRQNCVKNNNHIFGVVIGHPSWAKENIILIKAANLVSEKLGYSYYLKLHPNYEPEAFSSVVNNHYIGNIEKGTGILDYANKVDFSLVGSSSVFVELVFINHDTYRYSSGAVDDKYKSVKVDKHFSNLEELEELFTQSEKLSVMKDVFDYLCTVENVTESYKTFLNQFV